jgi:hypothetical protein
MTALLLWFSSHTLIPDGCRSLSGALAVGRPCVFLSRRGAAAAGPSMEALEMLNEENCKIITAVNIFVIEPIRNLLAAVKVSLRFR